MLRSILRSDAYDVVAEAENGKEAIEAGAKDFIVKPFNESKVIETVNRVLNRVE